MDGNLGLILPTGSEQINRRDLKIMEGQKKKTKDREPLNQAHQKKKKLPFARKQYAAIFHFSKFSRQI